MHYIAVARKEVCVYTPTYVTDLEAKLTHGFDLYLLTYVDTIYRNCMFPLEIMLIMFSHIYSLPLIYQIHF
jgi:hypothetical protein